MTNDLTVRHKLSKQAQTMLDKHKSDIRPGDTIVHVRDDWRAGWIYKVLQMMPKTVIVALWDEDHWVEHEDDSTYPITIEYGDLKDYVKYDGDPATLEDDVLATAKDPESALGSGVQMEASDETALALSQGKEPMLAAERALQASMNKALIARAIMEKKKDEISSIVGRFEEGLMKVRKVLHVAELYLGIDEQIAQIRDGAPAPANEPICIRQMILYMDEEYGDPTDGGLDWRSIDDFDAWTVKPENTQKVLPEQRGVVALQVRRHMKHCGENSAWAQDAEDRENSRTYLLIRNGEKLYRIWMQEHIHPRLFPRREELRDEIDGKERGYFDERDLRERVFCYKKYGVMLQGLIQRTDAFQPMAHEVDLFRPETCEGAVRFVRDDELLLPSGRLPWREWKEQINSKIGIGSRIVYAEGHLGYGRERGEEIRYRTGYSAGCPEPPGTGLYTVVPGVNGEEDSEHWRFIYNPGDHVWRRRDWHDDRPRLRSIGFHFLMDEVLNYDQMDLADIEFYIHCRTEREHYLDMLPLLYELRKQRLAEIEHEKGLVVMLSQKLDVAEQVVWDAIGWWKYKCRWKRSVASDDAKALRMIRKRIVSLKGHEK